MTVGATMNKTEMSNPKIILINFIYIAPNTTSNKMLEIIGSGANIYQAKQSTNTITPVIMLNEMTARLPDGSTIESSCIATLQLPGLSKQARQIHSFPKMKISPLISLGVLCDDEYTNTLYK